MSPPFSVSVSVFADCRFPHTKGMTVILFSLKVQIVLNLICVTVYILLRISRFLTSQDFTYLLSSYTQEIVNNGL